eukprot:scaffold6302_cov135-Isochrysis_galbana.AAC.1
MADIELDGLSSPVALSAARTSDGTVSVDPIFPFPESSNVAAVAGGVSGGVIMLLVVAALVAWWILKARPSLKRKKLSSVVPDERAPYRFAISPTKGGSSLTMKVPDSESFRVISDYIRGAMGRGRGSGRAGRGSERLEHNSAPA